MMAAKDTPSAKPDADATKDAEPTAAVPALRYLVLFPKISVIWEKEDKGEDGRTLFDEVIVPHGRYLDEFVPAEVATAKGPELTRFGMARAVAGRPQ